MFLLDELQHGGRKPGEHQHGVSIQISINLGKTFVRISRIRNISLTWILARVFIYVPPFISQILDFIYWTVLILILILFERRDTENKVHCKVHCGPRSPYIEPRSLIQIPFKMAYRHVVKKPTLQARIFLCNWYMKIVRPGRELPDNTVQFHVPME